MGVLQDTRMVALVYLLRTMHMRDADYFLPADDPSPALPTPRKPVDQDGRAACRSTPLLDHTCVQAMEQREPSAPFPLMASPSLGLSIEERGRDIERLLGFNQDILAYRLDESSRRIYARDIHAYLEFAQTPAQALIPGTEKGYSPNTINRMASTVRRLMKEAGKQGLLDPGVADAFSKVEGVRKQALKNNLRKHNRVRIEPATMRAMAQTVDRSRLIELRNLALLLTLASTGLRVETFRQLTLDQVVRREGGYAVSIRSKNEVEFRDVPLSDEAYAAISDWLATRPVASAFLFTRFDGGKSDSEHPRLSDQPLSTVSIRMIVKQFALAVGIVDEQGRIPIKPHDFRRFVGTMIAKKYGPKQAQLLLGHKQIATTLDNYVLEEAAMGITNHLF